MFGGSSGQTATRVLDLAGFVGSCLGQIRPLNVYIEYSELSMFIDISWMLGDNFF